MCREFTINQQIHFYNFSIIINAQFSLNRFHCWLVSSIINHAIASSEFVVTLHLELSEANELLKSSNRINLDISCVQFNEIIDGTDNELNETRYCTCFRCTLTDLMAMIACELLPIREHSHSHWTHTIQVFFFFFYLFVCVILLNFIWCCSTLTVVGVTHSQDDDMTEQTTRRAWAIRRRRAKVNRRDRDSSSLNQRCASSFLFVRQLDVIMCFDSK